MSDNSRSRDDDTGQDSTPDEVAENYGTSASEGWDTPSSPGSGLTGTAEGIGPIDPGAHKTRKAP